MKALSLHQPWATLVALGAKRYETRGWETSYRGPLLICSSKGGLCRSSFQELIGSQPVFQKALQPLLPPNCKHPILDDYFWGMCWGAALAVVDLVECLSTVELGKQFEKGKLPHFRNTDELFFGDFSPGRFAWKLENVRRLKKPFTVKGRQRLFEVDDPLLEGMEFLP